MTDRPIDIPASRIPALLDGRMTQYRTPLKPQPDPDLQIGAADFVSHSSEEGAWYWLSDWVGVAIARFKVPHAIGDRLWVREAHRLTDDGCEECVVYEADEKDMRDHIEGIERIQKQLGLPDAWAAPHLRKRPSITMPRWASRITLTVTDLAVHRVQEISEADAIAEAPQDHMLTVVCTFKDGFRTLYDTTHGPDAWERNDWVLATTFRVDLCNIDQMEEADD